MFDKMSATLQLLRTRSIAQDRINKSTRRYQVLLRISCRRLSWTCLVTFVWGPRAGIMRVAVAVATACVSVLEFLQFVVER